MRLLFVVQKSISAFGRTRSFRYLQRILKLRDLFVIVLGMMFLTCLGYAQEDNETTAVSSLQAVLSTLQQSVQKLSLDNDQLAAQDNYIKQQVLELQMQLRGLEAQGDVLNKTVARLQEKNARRTQQAAQLEKENSDLDNRIPKAESGIQMLQRSLDAGYREDQKLLLQLKGMTNVTPLSAQAQSAESQAVQRNQNEKLKLMKMIEDSRQRQEALHGSILEFQKNTALLPAVNALAHQRFLKNQIEDLEVQIAAYPPERLSGNFEFADRWDGVQISELESELKVLEKNYSQLKDLLGQMNKKIQKARMTASQHVEEEKLKSSIDDLNRQGKGLRADLDNLRSQMIDLDKRKSHLEMTIQQLP